VTDFRLDIRHLKKESTPFVVILKVDSTAMQAENVDSVVLSTWSLERTKILYLYLPLGLERVNEYITVIVRYS
jgi:hypothetical protein